MKSFLLVLAALAVSLPVSAGNTQVSAADYRVMGASGPYYGRSDGLFIDTTSKGPVIINNGTAADMFGKSYYEDFTKWGTTTAISIFTQAGLATASTTAGTWNMITMGDGLKLAQTAIINSSAASTLTTSGLEVYAGGTNTYGLETIGGFMGATGRPFVIGTDPAFGFCAKLNHTTVADITSAYAGFRKVTPFNATLQSEVLYAAVGHKGATSYTTSSLATSETETSGTDTLSDATTYEFCTLVSAAGVVTFTINGAAPTVTQAVTLTAGVQVIPFVRVIQAGSNTHSYLKTWKVFYQ